MTLADLGAAQASDAIVVTWETVSELDNRGFNLARDVGSRAGCQAERIPDPVAVAGQHRGLRYTWEDHAGLETGVTYWYWLEDLDTGGNLTRHEPISVDYVTPNTVGLAAFGGVAAAAGSALGGLAVLALAALGGVATRRAKVKQHGLAGFNGLVVGPASIR